MRDEIWTVEAIKEGYCRVAMEIGHTPKYPDLPRGMTSAMRRHGILVSRLPAMVGLTPNKHKHPPEPIPDGWPGYVPPKAPQIVPALIPPSPHALTPEELAAEREAHLERMRKKFAAEPKGTARPRKRFRDFTTAPRALNTSPDYLPARDALDVWRLTRRDAA